MKCPKFPCTASNIKVAVNKCNSRCKPSNTYETIRLKPNFCCKINSLTQEMLYKENVKYVIEYDFSLLGQTITVPKNCILEFDGGTLSNGTIIGQDTYINDVGGLGVDTLFGEGITRKGTWRMNEGGGSTPITIDSELSDTSTNPVQNKVIKGALDNKQDTLNSGQNIKTINGESILGGGNIQIEGGSSQEQVQSDWNETNSQSKAYIKNKPVIPERTNVDTAISETSTNPVQNKVITKEVHRVETSLNAFSTLVRQILQREISERQEGENALDERVAHLSLLYDVLRNAKADKGTTLEDYGINDAYTKGAIDNMYEALTQSNIVVGTRPDSGEANTIYRVPGENNYSDWMFYNNSWILLATYDNAIDDEPTIDSSNLVKSGGVAKVYGHYEDNPEFIKVITDEEGHFLFGIKKTGEIEWTTGVPKPIRELLDNAITKLYEDANLDLFKVVDNPEYLLVVYDKDDHFLFGVTHDGTFKVNKIDGKTQLDDTYKVVNDPEKRLSVTLDNEGKVLSYRSEDGTLVENKGIRTKHLYLSEEGLQEFVKSIQGGDAPISDANEISALYNSCRFNKGYPGNKDFQLLLLTDTHGENQAVTNAVTYANGYNTIDAMIHLGDIQAITFSASYLEVFNKIIDNSKKPVFTVIGNHDVGNTMYVHYGCSHIHAYNAYIAPMVNRGVLKNGEYTVNIPYYYHDFEERKIRLIVVYEYQAPLDVADNQYWEKVAYDSSNPMMRLGTSYVYNSYNPVVLNCGDYTGHSFRLKKSVTTINSWDADDDTMPRYRVGRADRVIMKDQAEWLIETLLRTPEDYGVVIACHNPAMANSTNQVDLKFASKSPYTGSSQSQSSMVTDLLSEIVNAFINKTTISLKVVMGASLWYGSDARYLNTLSEDGIEYCYKVNADFRNKNNSYFCGFIGGHAHKDLVFKHDSYEHMYGINPICGITEHYNNGNTDVSRPTFNDVNPAYNAITVASFANRRIGLARIGNRYTIDGGYRDFEVINV